MKDKDRKILTEWMGECWHDKEGRYETHTTGGNWAYDSIEHHYAPRCSKCKKRNPKNRTFTKWEDFGALKDRIVEKGKWPYFLGWVISKVTSSKVYGLDPASSDWLINKDRFPELVLEAIKEGVLK